MRRALRRGRNRYDLMAFIKKEWKDRLAEFAGRRRLTNIDTGAEMTVDVERDEGLVSQVGDSFSGKNMNDLEGRIEAAFTDCPTSTMIKKLERVQTLPSDAASHADTLYIIMQ